MKKVNLFSAALNSRGRSMWVAPSTSGETHGQQKVRAYQTIVETGKQRPPSG